MKTSFNAFLIRKYGYSKKGTRCVVKTNNQNIFKKIYKNFCYDN